MTMYPFIEQAQKEQDLQDFLDYLQEPLVIIHDLMSKYQRIAKHSNIPIEEVQGYSHLHKIIYVVFDKMISNYCSFSFTYRNTVKIKETNKEGQVQSYTAKELLLVNTAKIIEEIYLLEKQFNEGSKFNFLVDNRVISNLGFQTQIIQHEYEPEVVLVNKFDYKKYMATNAEKLFVKPVVHKPVAMHKPVERSTTWSDSTPALPTDNLESIFLKQPPGEDTLLDPPQSTAAVDNNSAQEENVGGVVLFMMAFVACVGIAVLMSTSTLERPSRHIAPTAVVQQHIEPSPIDKEAFNNISQLTQSIESFTVIYPNEPLSINYLKTTGFILPEQATNINPYKGSVQLTDATIFTNRDAYTITMDNLPKSSCQWMANELGEHVNHVAVNQHTVKGGVYSYTFDELGKACDKPANVLKITNTKIYKVDNSMQQYQSHRPLNKVTR